MHEVCRTTSGKLAIPPTPVGRGKSAVLVNQSLKYRGGRVGVGRGGGGGVILTRICLAVQAV